MIMDFNVHGQSGEHAGVPSEQLTNDVLMEIPSVKTIIEMGWWSLVQIGHRIRTSGKTFTTSEEIFDLIVKITDQKDSLTSRPTETTTPEYIDRPSTSQTAREESQETLENREEFQSACKVCWDHKYCMFFLPCQHTVTCQACAEKCTQCPICRTCITQKYKMYN